MTNKEKAEAIVAYLKDWQDKVPVAFEFWVTLERQIRKYQAIADQE